MKIIEEWQTFKTLKEFIPDFPFFYFIRTNNFRNKCYIKSSSRDIKNPMKQENGCNVLTKKVFS